jgi:hypothetical protein
MTRKSLLLGFAILTGLSAMAQAENWPVSASSQGFAMTVRHAGDQTKAISRTDKLTFDITGTIVDGWLLEADGSCGYNDFTALELVVRTKGFPMTVTCYGANLTACLSTHVGQRIRVVGLPHEAPDFLDPNFNACNPDTWINGPVNFLFVSTIYTR